jgi:hypothetical protein
MGKLMNWVGGVINRMAYIWLVTSEAFEEICYVAIGAFVRGIISAAETRQQAPKVEPLMYIRQTSTAKATDTILVKQ